MRRRTAIALLSAAVLLLPLPTLAVDVQLTGTFTMTDIAGTPPPDAGLPDIVGDPHSWSMILQNVQFICNEVGCFNPPQTTKLQYLTAPSFSFQFIGPQAMLLNTVVGQHFSQGGLPPHGAYFEVDSGDCFRSQSAHFYIWPSDPGEGVYMEIWAYPSAGTFPADENGCPIIGPATMAGASVVLYDRRGDNDYNIMGSGTITVEQAVAVQERTWGAVKAIYRSATQ